MTSIFVAKLDFGVSEEALRKLFEDHGTVIKCQIAKDRETGKPRGFAFVEMQNPEETQAAIRALDGYSFNGRSMVVKLAEDRNSGKNPGQAPRPQYNNNQDRRPSPPAGSTETKKKSDDDFRVPIVPPGSEEESSSDSSFAEKTAKRGKNKKKAGDKPENREYKMSAYRKTGKNSRIEFDDDDDWELEFRKNQKRGWGDDD